MAISTTPFLTRLARIDRCECPFSISAIPTKRRWFGRLTGDVLVESLFARDFGQKSDVEVRHSKAITFYDPEWTRPKDIFLTRLHVAVFYESGTDRKRTVPPIDPC